MPTFHILLSKENTARSLKEYLHSFSSCQRKYIRKERNSSEKEPLCRIKEHFSVKGGMQRYRQSFGDYTMVSMRNKRNSEERGCCIDERSENKTYVATDMFTRKTMVTFKKSKLKSESPKKLVRVPSNSSCK